jgi:hypothetical protein
MLYENNHNICHQSESILNQAILGLEMENHGFIDHLDSANGTVLFVV